MTVASSRVQAGVRRKSALLRRWQWATILMLLLVGVVNYFDRSTLSVGSPLIRQDLHLSVAQLGVLLSAFSWCYAFFQLPSGGMADRVGVRRWLTVGLAVWSIAQIISGTVVGFGQFVAARVLLGAGESPCMPSSNRATNNWFHVSQRSFPTGVWNSGSSLGPALGVPILTGVMLLVGWRGMFISMGIVGLLLAVVWYLFYREPHQTSVSAAEQADIGSDDAGAARITFRSWLALFAHVPTWGMILGFFGACYVGWIYLTWLPTYLEMARGLSVAATGLTASIPFFAGFVGSVFGGVVSDWLGGRGVAPIRSRKIPIVVGLLGGTVFTAVTAVAPSAAAAIACVACAEFFLSATTGMAWSMTTAVAPKNSVASLGSIQNFGGYIGAALAPAITGFIVQATRSFVPALLVGAAIALVAALLYAFMVRNPIRSPEALGLAE